MPNYTKPSIVVFRRSLAPWIFSVTNDVNRQRYSYHATLLVIKHNITPVNLRSSDEVQIPCTPRTCLPRSESQKPSRRRFYKVAAWVQQQSSAAYS